MDVLNLNVKEDKIGHMYKYQLRKNDERVPFFLIFHLPFHQHRSPYVYISGGH